MIREIGSSPQGSSTSPSTICLSWVTARIAKIYYRIAPEGSENEIALMTVHGTSFTTFDFFHEISKKLQNYTQVVIAGPDMMRFHLRFYLQEQRPHIYRRILAFESHETFGLAQAANVLKKYEGAIR